MTRDEWKNIEMVLNDSKVRLAMRGRCEEQGHDFESCFSLTFRAYEKCKWCGEER